jgi:RNA polymerase sigma-70 factor (ECF subfamily)
VATPEELSTFLAEVERRAFRQAAFAVRDDQAALDIVQDSMFKLAEKYADRPASEHPMLFQRILQNTIRDYFRRQKVRNYWTTALSFIAPGQDPHSEDADSIEHVQSTAESDDPVHQVDASQRMRVLQIALEKLPLRQREAFLLRYWEEMDTAETAKVMGCSEGSVKTHCSRAVHALSKYLESRGVTL